MDARLSLEEDLAAWLCSERCTAEDCTSVISHFSLFLFLLSVCKQWHSRAPAPKSQAERIVSIRMHGIIFKIYEDASPEILLDSFSHRHIEVGHILWSYKQPLIYALLCLICSSQGAEGTGREGAWLSDWASASHDADCLFVYMFGLLILSSGL